jgi:2-oxoisovalerate dehydrogenase E1 component
MDATIKRAIEDVRTGKPALIEIDCYRLNPHSKGDDNRSEKEVQAFREKDVLTQFSRTNSDEYTAYVQEADKFLDQIVAEAECAPKLTSVDTRQFVNSTPVTYETIPGYERMRGNDSIYAALKQYFSTNERAVMFGEDIAYQTPDTPQPYGGAFKVSKDLSSIFPDRVRNTPISESAIIGSSIGLALMGYTAVAEIMFGDFMTLTLDQLLQHASKFSSMYGRKVNLPLIVRTPMGGRRGYGPTHSQSIEKHFLGITDVNVAAINSAMPPEEVYKRLFERLDTPTIVIENKIQYTRNNFKVPNGFILRQTNEKLPTIVYRPDTTVTDLTIVCYGGMLEMVKSVVEKLAYEDIICEIIVPTLLVPLNMYPIEESVAASHRLLIVEEGSDFASLGSEIIANLCTAGIRMDAVKKMGNNTVIPCSMEAENALLPNEETIANAIQEML